ncbi:MAG: lytic transglycosylase domain-containing protein [Acidaminococcaceae bacterium]
MAKKKQPHTWSLRLAVLACLLFLGWQLWASNMIQKKYVYCWPYQAEILEYSKKNKLDPFLVAAVIKNESGFKVDAQSKPGALGLMQIMPQTGTWIASSMGMNNFTVEDLGTPQTNIRMGCWYLGELEYEFNLNWVLMLAAYNAGRGNTREWITRYGWDTDFAQIDDIPFVDTREYVRKVLYDREVYYQLYKNQLGNY